MIFKTSRVKNHIHHFIESEDGNVYMSTDESEKKKHTHGVLITPEFQTDELGNILVDEQGEPILIGNNIVVEDVNEHTHELTDEALSEELSFPETRDKDEVKKDFERLWKEATEYERKSRDSGEVSWDFRNGKQWEEGATNKLKDQKRAHLTINKTGALIDQLKGHQAQNRTDIFFYPVENGDQRVAEICNLITKNILDFNDYVFEETRAFEDQIVAGRGFLNVWIDYDENPEGDIRIEWFDWNSGRAGPHKRLDMKDCEYLIKDNWTSGAKIKQLYPDKADEISRYSSAVADESNKNDLQHDDIGSTTTLSEEKIYDVQRKEFRLMELWQKVYGKSILVTIGDNFIELGNLSSAVIASIKTIPSVTASKKNVTAFRVITYAGDVVLDNELLELPKGANTFHLIPLYAYKKGSSFYGKIEMIKDLQREKNKRRSQCADAINSMKGHGWFYDGDTFADEADMNAFQSNSASSGWMQRVEDLARLPFKVEGGRFPNELVAFEQLADSDMNMVMGIPPEMMGMGSGNESGVAIMEKRRQGLISNEFLFDNLDLAKKKLGKMILAYVQEIYTPERIARLVLNQTMRDKFVDPALKDEQTGDPLDELAIINLLGDADLTKYDVVTSTSRHTPTAQHINYMSMLQAISQGAPLPPEFLIKYNPYLPRKEEALADIEAYREAELQAERLKSETEIAKTQIAQEGRNSQVSSPSNAPMQVGSGGAYGGNVQ